MKRCLFALLLVISQLVYGQSESARSSGSLPDTLLKGYSLIFGIGVGPGFNLGAPVLEKGYDELLLEHTAYPDFRAEAGVLWNEKFGFRLLIGRQGIRGNAYSFYQYANEAYPGYKYLTEYSDFYSGYSYSYVTPQFIYKVGKEPFNCTFSAGFGTGKLCMAYGRAELQQDGSNNFMEVNYSAEKVWNYNATAGADIAYMRQLSPHLFCNTGVYVSYNAVMLDFDYTYTEQLYNQPVSFRQTYDVHHTLGHINAGIFLNFQWNSKESERAFYY